MITEVSTDDYLVVLYPNRDTEELTGYIAGTVHYFESDATFSFILPDNAEAGPRLILNDRVYYFEQVSQPGEENVVFELKVLELGSAMNRISTGLKVSNAEPESRALTPRDGCCSALYRRRVRVWELPIRSARREPNPTDPL